MATMVWRVVILTLAVCFYMSTASFAVPGQCGACPDTWTRFGDSCYLFADNKQANWVEAAYYCTNQSAHLASVESAAEDTFINQYLKRLFRNSKDRAVATFWLGATDEVIEGEWIWFYSSKVVNYTHWRAGQPNSYHGHNEDCLAIEGHYGFTWADNICTNRAHPLCEREIPRSSEPTLIG